MSGPVEGKGLAVEGLDAAGGAKLEQTAQAVLDRALAVAVGDGPDQRQGAEREGEEYDDYPVCFEVFVLRRKHPNYRCTYSVRRIFIGSTDAARLAGR